MPRPGLPVLPVSWPARYHHRGSKYGLTASCSGTKVLIKEGTRAWHINSYLVFSSLSLFLLFKVNSCPLISLPCFMFSFLFPSRPPSILRLPPVPHPSLHPLGGSELSHGLGRGSGAACQVPSLHARHRPSPVSPRHAPRRRQVGLAPLCMVSEGCSVLAGSLGGGGGGDALSAWVCLSSVPQNILTW